MTIPRYFGFTDFTPVIPQLYWNVYSNEQRIKALCKELCKIIQYADMLSVNVDEIKQTLQDIEDGELDPIIVEAIEQWFNENQPEIMNSIETIENELGEGFSENNTVRNEIDSINNIIGNGFSESSTVTNAVNTINDSIDDIEDAIGNINGSITSINDEITYIDQFTNEVDVNSYVFPEKVGIIRTPTNLYNTQPENVVNWAQGFSIHDGFMAQAIVDTQLVKKPLFYTRNVSSQSWNTPIEENAFKVSSIKFIAPIDKYYVGTGRSDEIVILDSGFHRTGRNAIGSTGQIILLAFDKVTGKLYGTHYGNDLFEFDDQYSTRVTYLSNWNNAIDTDNGYLQDIAAYNGFLYLLYSSTGRIEKRRISDGQYIATYYFSNKQHNTFIGECEGIDIDEDGVVYFSSNLRYVDMNAYQYAYIWKFDPDNPSANVNQWFSSIAGNTRVVTEPTSENLLANQNADGSGNNPYVTIAEALFDIMINSQLTTIALRGNHEDEFVAVNVPNLTIEGNDATVKIGGIRSGAAKLSLNNLVINPLVELTYKITGYRSGILLYNTNTVTFGNSTTATSGYNIGYQGIIVDNFAYKK